MSRFQLVSDAQWQLIADQLPKSTGREGRPFADARTVVEGISYRYRCGTCQIPSASGRRCGPGTAAFFADGTWELILKKLQAQADAERLIDWTVSEDSIAARAHQHATNVTRHTGGFVE